MNNVICDIYYIIYRTQSDDTEFILQPFRTFFYCYAFHRYTGIARTSFTVFNCNIDIQIMIFNGKSIYRRFFQGSRFVILHQISIQITGYPIVRTSIGTIPLRKGEKNFLSVSDLLWLFVIGAFLGDMVETVFCRVTAGVWMSRSSLVWGPFSVVWGLALVLATVLLRQEKDRSDRYLFAFGTVMGGVYEYVCSAVTELLFGTVFWDYSGFKFNLGGRINLLYCFFWGIAAVTWMRYGYPLVAKCMGKLKSRIRPWMTAALAVFMAVNMLVSALALARYDARTSGVEAANPVDVVLDAHFDNARMERIYPNAKKVSSHAR